MEGTGCCFGVRAAFGLYHTPCRVLPLACSPEIDTLIITGGFETREIPRLLFAIASSPTIVPGGFAKVTVGFTAPTSTGKALGRLRIFIRQPLAPVEEVLLTASVVDGDGVSNYAEVLISNDSG